MMSIDRNLPLSELLRPKTVQELKLPEAHVLSLQRMLDSGNWANMLFFGPPGLGKTSAARIFLCARGDYGTLTIDGSNEDKNVRKLIETFASCVPFTPGLKICFIDEANFLLKPARAALRGAIERFSANCRFILATNDVTEIDPAVRSRLLNIHFAAPREDDQELVERIQERISARMVELGWSFDRKRLDTIILENLSDFRRMANKIEFEFPRSTERGDTE